MNEHGLESGQFKRFEKVISGHFHKKSDDGISIILEHNTKLCGQIITVTKGFHIFDTETRELERIENPLKIFKKFMYDDTKTNYDHSGIQIMMVVLLSYLYLKKQMKKCIVD